jgi:hypothetical protein
MPGRALAPGPATTGVREGSIRTFIAFWARLPGGVYQRLELPSEALAVNLGADLGQAKALGSEPFADVKQCEARPRSGEFKGSLKQCGRQRHGVRTAYRGT